MDRYGIQVQKECKDYPYLLNYRSFDAMCGLFKNRVLWCTPLNASNLNDQFEAQRKGIEEYAGSFFITCFSHCQHEIVPFWFNYGGQDDKRKVLLKIKNFSADPEEAIWLDYCLSKDKDKSQKRILFDLDYDDSNSTSPLESECIKSTDESWEKRFRINYFKIVDVKYNPPADPVFSRNYLQKDEVYFGSTKVEMPSYHLGVLGRYKTHHWNYEKETRIICTATPATHSADWGGHIELRLKDKFFEGMEVVLNPWATEEFEKEVKDFVNSSSPCPIPVRRSELDGQVVK